MAIGDGIQGVAERFLWPELCGGARWKIFLTTFITRSLLVLAALALVLAGLRALMPEKPKPDRVRSRAAEICAKTIQNELRVKQGEYRTLVCMPFTGDSTDAVFEATRNALSSSGTFDVCDQSLGERLYAYFDVQLSGSNDAERAARRVRRFKADAALCGSVSRFETLDGRAILVVDYRLIDAEGDETFTGTYDSTKKVEASDVSSVADKDSTTPGVVRGISQKVWINYALWIFAVLAIPIFSFRILEFATAKRSNRANAFALAACLLADAACAWVFVQPTFNNAATILGVALIGVLALWYDLQFLRLAHRRTAAVFSKP